MLDLRSKYNQEIRPQLLKTLGLSNLNEVPKIQKITVNMGVGEAVSNKKSLEGAVADLQLITGQKPLTTLARKSVASFKLREGWPVGCKVTLRGPRMYDFLFRVIHIGLPRVRDFRGLSAKSFDGRGNYSFGVKEQIIFPEIDYDKVDALRGLDITITTSSINDANALELLKAFNFPITE
jgi:large subunit ribosomal protein L5